MRTRMRKSPPPTRSRTSPRRARTPRASAPWTPPRRASSGSRRTTPRRASRPPPRRGRRRPRWAYAGERAEGRARRRRRPAARRRAAAAAAARASVVSPALSARFPFASIASGVPCARRERRATSPSSPHRQPRRGWCPRRGVLRVARSRFESRARASPRARAAPRAGPSPPGRVARAAEPSRASRPGRRGADSPRRRVPSRAACWRRCARPTPRRTRRWPS